MITPKQRAFLRKLAVSLDPVMQIGKDGLKEESIEQINGLLEARELVKIKVLNNCDSQTKELANMITIQTKCDVVQVIGKIIVLFRVSTKKGIKHIQLP